MDYGDDAKTRGPQPAHSGHDEKRSAGAVHIFAQSARGIPSAAGSISAAAQRAISSPLTQGQNGIGPSDPKGHIRNWTIWATSAWAVKLLVAAVGADLRGASFSLLDLIEDFCKLFHQKNK
jgi:hypothetical protein